MRQIAGIFANDFNLFPQGSSQLKKPLQKRSSFNLHFFGGGIAAVILTRFFGGGIPHIIILTWHFDIIQCHIVLQFLIPKNGILNLSVLYKIAKI